MSTTLSKLRVFPKIHKNHMSCIIIFTKKALIIQACLWLVEPMPSLQKGTSYYHILYVSVFIPYVWPHHCLNDFPSYLPLSPLHEMAATHPRQQYELTV